MKPKKAKKPQFRRRELHVLLLILLAALVVCGLAWWYAIVVNDDRNFAPDFEEHWKPPERKQLPEEPPVAWTVGRK